MLSRLLHPCSIVRVQSWDSAASVPSASDPVAGVRWPLEVGTVAAGLVDVLCIGPTEWLVIGRNADGAELCGRLGTALGGSALSATDVSQGLGRIELEGPAVREFLLKGCSLDLHPDRFPPGRCARTRFAGIPTVLRCQSPSTFEGIVAASHLGYLQVWIAHQESEMSSSW